MIISQFTIGYSSYTGTSSKHEVLLTNLSQGKAYWFQTLIYTKNSDIGVAASSIVTSQNVTLLHGYEPLGSNRYRGNRLFRVEARETVAIRLRPSGPGGMDQNLGRTHGYLVLRMPLVFSSGELQSQGDTPVDVLLQASRVDWNQSDGFHNRAAIPISTGQAENKITPEKKLDLSSEWMGQIADLETRIDDGSRQEARGGERFDRIDTQGFIEDPGSISSVVSYLSALGDDEQSLIEFNKILRRAGRGIQIERGE
jgi:hypothetical protein